MHWILQDNLFNEAAYQELLNTLVRFELPHSVHKVIPFIGELTPPVELPTNNVICMGSYSLRHAAKKAGWYPGVFDLEPFDFRVQLENWGNHMLNADSEVVAFKNAKFPTWSLCSAHQVLKVGCSVCDAATGPDRMFIRPIEDSKVFAGKVFDKEEFEEWQRKVVVLEEDYGSSLSKDTLIQVSYLKEIYVEARFWVVKGTIVCASIYKRGTKVIYSDEVPESYFDYARARVAEWQPHDAFVIDIADTSEGLKIVEINTLNSSGFYAANIPKLVMALEEAFNKD